VQLEYLDGPKFKQMFLGGAARLNARKEEINDLNVFPVPDGDTGTNMVLTIQAAIQELKKDTDNSVNTLAKGISLGSLMGARGNSGVILSQLFRGFAKAVEGKDTITALDFARALQEGVNSAYRAVLKPVEGTMLTVAKEAAKAAQDAARQNSNIIYMLEKVVEQSLDTVNRTPGMLPVLKQAGVVDAGGKGVYYMYGGYLSVLLNPDYREETAEPLEPEQKPWAADALIRQREPWAAGAPEPEPEPEPAHRAAAAASLGDIEFIYCTEFIIKGKDLSAEVLLDRLVDLGDSLLVVGEDTLLKVHVHTNFPGRVLEISTELGTLHAIKIDNMLEQHQETRWSEADLSGESEADLSGNGEAAVAGIGVITVAAGEGFKELLASMGADAIIEGGQTMNPSTEDFLKEVKRLPMQELLILPNNKNIILAAEQARKLSDKEIRVIPSTTLPQGIAALLSLNKVELTLEENRGRMEKALSTVKTGQVTLAIRDSRYNGQVIAQGDYIGMNNGDLTVVRKSLAEAVAALLEEMVQEEDELITFYYGQDMSSGEAAALIQALQEHYEDKEFEVYNGGQPLYHFVISIE
jgi:uncharacterized protein